VNTSIRRTLSPIPVPAIPPDPAQRDADWLAGFDRRDFLELGAIAAAPGTARGVIRERLPWWGLGHLQYTAELVASELITNSVAATRDVAWVGRVPPVRLWLLGSDVAVAILVWDAVARKPVRRDVDWHDESGRGLGIVDALSADWDSYLPQHPFRGKVTRAFIK
jgi:hypothetical protein